MSLKIFLLGQFNLSANNLPLELPSRSAQSLLAYLALNAGVTQRREKLASLLWPEATENNARKYLRQTLWRIHKTLQDASLAWEDYLQVSDIEVVFNQQSDYWLDADLLLARPAAQPVDQLVEIVSLYQGELLPGFYDQWIVLERERLQMAFHQKMNQLLEGLLQISQWPEALEWAEHWIRLGYSPEPAYRALMIAYAGLGDQGMVSATYQRCVTALNRDLGLEPSPETRLLFEQLVSGESLPTILDLPEPKTLTIPEETPAPGSPPYKGLDYFDIQDTDLFFGREALTTRLAARLREAEQLLFVVGASGSGKSSLVRAGLVPTLTSGESLVVDSPPPDISSDWLVHVIQPTAQPLETLASALCQDETSLSSVAALIDDLRQDPRSLHLCARRLCQDKAADRLLLVVDQFEELFTLCQDEEQRAAFIDNILAAVDPQVSGPTSVLITLRADFYAHCAQYPGLRQQLAAHQEYIGPMSSEELRQAIEEPARKNDWEFEPGLVDLILRDVKGQPGSLPLLSHALLETWLRRRGRILTLKAYAEAGSVHGAIAHTAEAVYQQDLDGDQQVIARHIFLRLTELGEDAPETRRRAKLSELLPAEEQHPDVEAVLEKLVTARLVTLSEDYAEVSHEALIREWPTLRGWLEADRQDIKLHHQLTEATLAWEALEQDESALYRGARLAAALEWAQEHRDQVNILEQEFLESSKNQAELRQKEQARANRRLRGLAVGLAGVLVVAVLSAAYAFNQRSLFQREAHMATSRQYAAAGLNNLDADPELGILIALEAVDEAQSAGLPVPREAQEALHHSLRASRLEMVIDAHPGGVREIDYSPDGERLVSVGKDFNLKVWDTGSGQLLNSTRATNIESTHVAYSPDGKYLATSDHDLTSKIWDSQTLVQLASLEGHESGVMTLAFSPDGTRLVTSSGSTEGFLYVWDLKTHQIIGQLGGGIADVFEAISYSLPDGKLIAAASSDGTLRIWDAATFEEIHRLDIGDILSLDFSPDGSRLAVSRSSDIGESGYVTILDLTNLVGNDTLANPADTIKEAHTFYAHADDIMDLEFSPDGTRLATSSLDRTAKIWEVSTRRELLQLSGHRDRILSLAFDPSGDHLATGSMDGTIRIWNISHSREYLSFPTGGGAGRIAFSPDGTRLAAGTGRFKEINGQIELVGEVHLWDLATGEERVTFSGGDHPGGVEAVAFSPDGSQLASVGVDDSLKIWDVNTGQLLASNENLGLDDIWDVVYSPDGSQLAIGGYSYSIILLDAANAKKLDEFIGADAVSGLTFSPDGSQLVSTTGSGIAVFWDISTGKELQTIGEPGGRIEDITFNPDGDRLALASSDGTLIIWSPAKSELQLVLRGHSAPVMGVDYSPDGRWIATASMDGSARLWDAITGEELLLLKPAGGAGLVDIAFSPDGKLLATSGDDALRVFMLEIDDLVNLAKSRLSRSLTPQECLKFFADAHCEKLVEPTPTVASVASIGAAKKICLMSDPVGITKFNIHYRPYLGVVEAADRHGWEWQVFISDGYETMSEIIERALGSDCELIIALGWIVGDMINEYHIQHPEQKFLLLDYSYDTPIENVWTSLSAADQGGFLAGYLAAAMSQTGVIGTFGSVNIPAVTDFLIGFESGMHYYNQKYNARVRLLGWDSVNNEGEFIGGFLEPELGYQFTQSLLERGADIIFPAGGAPTNYGALLAIMEDQQAYVIGLDLDYKQIFPEFGEIILTSVLKRFDQSVLRAADAIVAGNFKGGTYLGTLETGELDLAPFYELEDTIPEQIKADLEQIKADIIVGKIQTRP